MVFNKQTINPFLKWAGGKRQLISEIYPRIPVIEGRYIEPFILFLCKADSFLISFLTFGSAGSLPKFFFKYES